MPMCTHGKSYDTKSMLRVAPFAVAGNPVDIHMSMSDAFLTTARIRDHTGRGELAIVARRWNRTF
jgi:hypothetical protein